MPNKRDNPFARIENPFAFPRQEDSKYYAELGMTLRDWFAGQYLMGITADSKAYGIAREKVAELAYKMADAMLKERMKQEGKDEE